MTGTAPLKPKAGLSGAAAFYYYTYDGNNRVIKVGASLGASNVASYAYNSRGLRVSYNVGSNNPVEWLFDVAGNAFTATVPGTSSFYESEYFVGGRNWGTIGPNGMNWVYSDWLGTGRMWQDINRNTTQTCSGLPFGDGLSCSVYKFGNGMFTGDWYDKQSITYHTPARELSPTQGRWLTPDPAGLAALDPTNPQTWNRYAYVLNNPVSAIDPTGLDCVYVNDDAYSKGGATDNGYGVSDGVSRSVSVIPGDCASENDNGYYVPQGKFGEIRGQTGHSPISTTPADA